MILGKVNVPYSMEDIKVDGKWITPADNLYDTLMYLARSKCLIMHEKKLAYADEIRANYRDGELYIPMFSCKKVSNGDIIATYDNKIEKVILHNYKTGYAIDKIYVIINIMEPVAYEFEIGGLKLSRAITDRDRQARDLFYKYIACAYGYDENDIDLFDYIKVQKQFAKASQKKLIRDNGLEFYGEYIDLDYRDVRNWKLLELEKHFTSDELQTNVAFGIKRLAFELELYTRLYEGVYWEGWTLGSLKTLLNDKIDYLKYKEKSIYLIFKKRWLRG